MRGYERDDYENWDEYEEDGEEQYEEEEEGDDDGYEEPEQPTQEQLDYLELRQRLKESIRKKIKKESGTNASSRDRTNSFRKDNYGSFFGPSQPVIAQRVIQESRSLLENPELAARITNKSSHINKKSSGSAPSSRPQVKSRPTIVNGVKKKVEMIKNTRDYSFLLSDDAEVPAPSKNPPIKHVSAPKSDARPVQVPPKSRQVVNDRGRDVSNPRDVRKPMAASSQSKPKVVPERSNGKLPVESRRQLGNNNGSGPGRPLPHKVAPSKTSVPATRKVIPPVARSMMPGLQRPTPSSQQPVRKPTSHMQSGTHRRSPAQGQPSVVNKQSIQRRDYHETSKPKVVPKQPPSRDQLRRPPPKPSAPDKRPKPKPKRRFEDDDSDGENAINMIRKMFGYNPNRFRDDDDVSDMEANFDDILREEDRSARIARQEDEEQLRLIEEEERRERLRLAKKKQKVR